MDLEKAVEQVSPTDGDSTQSDEPSNSSSVWHVLRFIQWPVKFLYCWSPANKSGSSVIPSRMGQTIVRKLEDSPKGFPRLSCYLDSDESFMVYRRFGCVFSRLLLNKQDELGELENALREMDQDDASNGRGRCLMSRTIDNARPAHNRPEPRQELLRRMEIKALEYSNLAVSAKRLLAMGRPASRDYRSVRNFLEGEGGQLFEEESQFIYEKDDLITLKPGREHAWLDDIIERILLKLRWLWPIEYIFCSKETKRKTDDPYIHYFTRGRISVLVTMLITLVILVLLAVPVWLLYRLSVAGTIATSPITVVLIIVFTLLFSAAISLFTRARRHEILVASAGYCALLMVFLSNLNDPLVEK